MGLKVLLYDPKGEITHFLADIFEVTGHTLYSASSEEEVSNNLKNNPDFFLLPFSLKEVWINSLNEHPTIPIFFVFSEDEEIKARELGIPEINLVRVPFNPLEFFERLGLLHKKEIKDFKEIELFNTLIKSLLRREGIKIKIKGSGKECLVNSYPVTLSCTLAELKEILRSEHELEEGEDFKERIKFDNLTVFFGELFKEEEIKREREVKPVEKLKFVRTVSKEYRKGIFKKNFYLLGNEAITLINLSSADSLALINKVLMEEGLSLKDVKLVLFTDFEPASLEAARRLLAVNQSVSFIGRKHIKDTLENFGLKNVRFRSIEEIPSLRFNLPEVGTVKILPFKNSPQDNSVGYYLEGERILFSGKFLGSFGGDADTLETFHRVFFPCRSTVEYNLGLIGSIEGSFDVFPFYGERRSIDIKTLNKILDYKVKSNFLEREVILGLVNGILLNMDEEERENLLGYIGYLVEVDEKVIVDFYTEPNLFYEEFINTLPQVVKEKEEFYTIIEKLLEHNFYVPLRTV